MQVVKLRPALVSRHAALLQRSGPAAAAGPAAPAAGSVTPRSAEELGGVDSEAAALLRDVRAASRAVEAYFAGANLMPAAAPGPAPGGGGRRPGGGGSAGAAAAAGPPV